VSEGQSTTSPLFENSAQEVATATGGRPPPPWRRRRVSSSRSSGPGGANALWITCASTPSASSSISIAARWTTSRSSLTCPAATLHRPAGTGGRSQGRSAHAARARDLPSIRPHIADLASSDLRSRGPVRWDAAEAPESGPRRRRSKTKRIIKPKWRNGRRGGLKIHCPQGREGSSPSFGTQHERAL
jgi:hypothetical protein